MSAPLNLNDINAFIIISQQGSFTKAAQVIGCSRSQLSKQLNNLEKDLGVCLISRSTRQQQLTESGQVFFDQCLSALQNIEQAMLTTVEGNNRLQGRININSVGGVIGEEIISVLVNDFYNYILILKSILISVALALILLSNSLIWYLEWGNCLIQGLLPESY